VVERCSALTPLQSGAVEPETTVAAGVARSLSGVDLHGLPGGVELDARSHDERPAEVGAEVEDDVLVCESALVCL